MDRGFVTGRRPNVVPADRDRCSDTGLGRLFVSDGLDAAQPKPAAVRRWMSFDTLRSLISTRSASRRSGPSQEPAPRSAYPDRLLETGVEAVAALTFGRHLIR